MVKITKRFKNILLVIGFLLMLLLLFGDLFYLKKTVVSKEIPETVYVINETEYDVSLKTKLIINKIFSHDSIYIKFDYMNEPLYIEGIEIAAHVVKNPMFENQYLVLMSKKVKPYHEDIILAHELTHVNQFEILDLEYINVFMGIYKYKDDTININEVSYKNRPDEIDAYTMEDSVFNELQILLKEYKK